ncbi:MAG: hypothetical protein FJ217_03445 [Ignavibacteria bacterium]|nr:hypothetical protein [Ignavibacteria bacterium]
MIHATKENTVGWVGSIVFHLCLLLLFLLVNVPEILQQEEFVEISWGSVTGAVQAASAQVPSRGDIADLAGSTATSISKPAQVVAPPERRLPDFSDEVIRVPRTEKLMSTEADPGRQKTAGEQVAGEREPSATPKIGDKETRLPGSGAGNLPGQATPSAAQGSISGNIDQGVSYAIQWLGGGTRKKISGDLPKYPPGVNVETQIKILAVVLPNGSIKGVQPAQKGNTALEEAAMKEVRHWEFEPLKPSQPQVDQRCEIVFLFTLK